MVEPISTSLAIFASVMSIAASIKQLMQDRNVPSEEALKLFQETASPKEIEVLESPANKSAIIELTTISDKLLKQLSKEAQECEDQHIKDRKDAGGKIDEEQAESDAEQCMCSVLRTIKRRNKRQLPPSGPLIDWWESYNCKD
ncbi:MAG: hypothetical protein ACPGO3_05630 [Magnetospiraceae bacterium]